MAIFDWMADMAIDAAGGKTAVFGSKPGVAEYTPTDLGTEAKTAATANAANMPEITALLNKILPGYSDLVAQGSKNTMSLLRGELPQDVQDKVRRNSAFKAFSGGYGGSGMSKALTARDFGRTSLDLMQVGENSAQRWASLTQGSVAPYAITAGQQADATFKNNLYKQATEQFKMNVAAAPDPGAAGMFNTIATIGGTAASFGTMGMGGGSKAAAPATAPAAYSYAYPAPTYAAAQPTANQWGNSPYGWPAYGG